MSSTVSFVIYQISLAHLDAVHGAHFGTHGYHERAIAQARSQSAFVQLASQRAREARVTYASICTYTRQHHFNNCIYGSSYKRRILRWRVLREPVNHFLRVPRYIIPRWRIPQCFIGGFRRRSRASTGGLNAVRIASAGRFSSRIGRPHDAALQRDREV